jgi:hypothetical protein
MDMFGHAPMAFGEAMSADQAVILFAGPNGWSEAGILTTNMMLQYTQPVMRIYDFGAVGLGIPASQYFIIGRPQGQGNFGKIIGPRPINYCFYLAFGQGCAIKNNNFMVAVGAGCKNATVGNFAFSVNHCVLQSFGFQVASQDMMFQANLPFMFISLQIPTVNAFACGAFGSMGIGLGPSSNYAATLATSFSTTSTNTSNSGIVSNNNSTPITYDRPAIAVG